MKGQSDTSIRGMFFLTRDMAYAMAKDRARIKAGVAAGMKPATCMAWDAETMHGLVRPPRQPLDPLTIGGR